MGDENVTEMKEGFFSSEFSDVERLAGKISRTSTHRSRSVSSIVPERGESNIGKKNQNKVKKQQQQHGGRNNFDPHSCKFERGCN
ncbi:hypothetical protein CK203_010300 [Vitis vinifera]|uniref:Uncharacterized protein n=1 Tax=Vitis vinifera TaxID=29760 RepID=A0A438JXE6_VITVI|nr:hypothetical protein CK203_010300 [Vitis vinifera]